MRNKHKFLFIFNASIIIVVINLFYIISEVSKIKEIERSSYHLMAKNLSTLVSFPLFINNDLEVIKTASIVAKVLPEGLIKVKRRENDGTLIVNPNNILLDKCKNKYKNLTVLYNGADIGELSYCYSSKISYFETINFTTILLITIILSLFFYFIFYNLKKEQQFVNNRLVFNRQIAHDIRSPLEALKSIANNLDSLDYNTKRIVTNSIGRISDIANGLLKTGKEEQKEFMPGSLGILIDDIISDKSFERDASINYESKITYKDTYMLGNENQLYRAISNIINNGIEAQENDAKIDIKLDKLNGELVLTVKDYGKGMDEQTALKVLDGGYTTKEKGNGLGLSYAKKVIEEHGGNLILNSQLGQGTEIKISLPSIEAPRWLVDELMLEESSQKIVCVDDDPSFLELYKDKFKEAGIEVITFTEKEIEKTMNVENAQFYFDYDLGKEHSGLDFIIENGLANFSTLVTSMHQDEQIQSRCIQHGIRILPKQMFNKAKVIKVPSQVHKNLAKQYILIDDDELMHMTWKMEADKKAIEFKAYSSVEEFIKDADQYAKDSVIYVDSNLADGLKGEIESEKISKLGFSEIYLATGFSADDLEKPEWIKEIVGKRPEFK